ncbi:MAG: hypothetical protein IIW56_09260, partial [Oscillospiraceae bacterium]|nr:hypothetical protein [Oscillospiraceae bacterium]
TNMLNAIQAGIFNASTKQRLDELEQRKADIELQIIQEEMRHPMLTREDVTYWFCRYRMLDTKRLEERRRLIDGFVNSVIVYDEYIVITFNYKEGTTTVPFSKLDSSDLSSVGGPKDGNGIYHSRLLHSGETRKINAARMSAAGDGLTDRTSIFFPSGRKCKRVSPLGRENSRHLNERILTIWTFNP